VLRDTVRLFPIGGSDWTQLRASERQVSHEDCVPGLPATTVGDVLMIFNPVSLRVSNYQIWNVLRYALLDLKEADVLAINITTCLQGG